MDVVPDGVVTLTVLGVVEATALLKNDHDCVRVVPLADAMAGSLMIPAVEPERFTVEPATKFVPVSVTVKTDGNIPTPRVCDVGLMEARVGAPAFVTVNVTVAVPPAVVTVTVWAPTSANELIVNVAVMVVPFTTTKLDTGTCGNSSVVPETVTPVAVVKLVPVMVTLTDVSRAPEVGEMLVIVGAGGAWTVKVTPPVVPPGVVTVIDLAPTVAPAAIANVAVTDVPAPLTVVPLTVIPVPALMVAPARFVPVSVTATDVPRIPVLGEIEVSVGAAGGGSSIAPTSTGFPLVFLGLP